MCKENIEYAERNIHRMFEKHSRTVVKIMFAYECEEPEHNLSFVVVSAYGSLYEAIWWVNDNVFQVHALNNDSENAFYDMGVH